MRAPEVDPPLIAPSELEEHLSAWKYLYDNLAEANPIDEPFALLPAVSRFADGSIEITQIFGSQPLAEFGREAAKSGEKRANNCAFRP